MAINMRSANQISLKIWQVSGVFIRADSNLALRAHRATEPSLLSLRESGTLIGRDGETYRLRLRFFVEDLQFTSDQKGCSVFDGSICEIFVQKSAQNQQRDFSWTATLRLSSRAMILRKGFLLSPDERRRRENPCRDLVLYGTREVSLFGPAPEVRRPRLSPRGIHHGHDPPADKPGVDFSDVGNRFKNPYPTTHHYLTPATTCEPGPPLRSIRLKHHRSMYYPTSKRSKDRSALSWTPRGE
mmetsp:Transcript_67386/g.185721  ORF Transcript_67386/g.185721 Transcript_67386/m.185721 type:complete len:242 (+) Transcript_67386:40-765(+)